MYHTLVTDVELTVEAVALYFEVELSKNPLVSFCPEREEQNNKVRDKRGIEVLLQKVDWFPLRDWLDVYKPLHPEIQSGYLLQTSRKFGQFFFCWCPAKKWIKNNQVALWQGLLYIEFVEEIIWSPEQYGINKHE